LSEELQRVSELRDFALSLKSPRAYFWPDDTKFSDPRKRRFFLEIERDLRGLDAEAWNFLKQEALPRLKAKDPDRGWQQLFDTLNEAKGYNHLVAIGCTEVRFVPRAAPKHIRTPDLEGVLASTKVLCEVKTVNPSADEIARRNEGGVGTTRGQLEQDFFCKLSSVLRAAACQMLAFNTDEGVRRIAYLVVNFDDRLHEYAGVYESQIRSYLQSVSA
jgi:hypothetical protein